MSKKKWTTLQLIILLKGKPEEAVFSVCKYDVGVWKEGFGAYYSAC